MLTHQPPFTYPQAEQLNFAKSGGLLPAIIQHAISGELLMLGYMNADALNASTESGNVTFWSRSKQRLWVKGETSGHYLKLVSITADCDLDALLILALPQGATCHTGSSSCFSPSSHQWHFLWQLEQLIEQRKQADASQSYTARLYASGSKRIAQKVAEEGVETALAAVAGDSTELINEASDLLYHLLVLLHQQNLSLEQVIDNLRQRHQ